MPRRLATVALAVIALCVAALVALHVVEPGLDPRDHTVSEYANTSTGWLGTTALAAWSVALFAASWAVGGSSSARWSSRIAQRAVVSLLAFAALGLATAACFHTQAVAGRVPAGVARTNAGILHDAGAGGATVAIFVAATLSGVIARDRGVVRVSRGVVVSAVVVQVALLSAGPSLSGIRQRLLIALALGWLAIVNMRVDSPDTAGDDTETTWSPEPH
jgi:hypothetical protein